MNAIWETQANQQIGGKEWCATQAFFKYKKKCFNIIIIRMLNLQELATNMDQKVCLSFIDLRKAYDSVNRCPG